MDEIYLIIKAPNQKYEDLKIKCQLSWTILDLKIYLCKEYPSKPIISDQRLIYSGHLLKDEQRLQDILQSTENESNIYTFHLVCPQRQASSSDQSNKVPPEQTATSQAELSREEMSSTFASFSPNDTFPNRNPLLNHFGSTNPAFMHESYNAMMSQYYQYMSYYYLSAPPVTDHAAYYAFVNAYMSGVNPNITTVPNLNSTNGNINHNANGANENQANAPAPNNNPNNNNQADNEEVNRDWTEMLYSFSKAMVMLSIMYFYSSFGRLLLLIAIGVILYMYKNGRFNGAQNIINNNNEQENVREPPPMDQANNNEANNDANAEPDSPANADSGDSTNGTIPENLRYSGIRLVWVFVSSLFTSLIPDPTPIN